MTEREPLFDPPLALASLSGEADAAWARNGAAYAGAAFLGGIALDEPTRAAARGMVDRERTEFLPPDPFSFVDDQLEGLSDLELQAGFNVRAASPEPVARAAERCARHDAILEINAHCRQDEMCAAGAGESLLADVDRLCAQVEAASATGALVSVKVRAEVPGVDLPTLSASIEAAGADIIHVDAMDSESVIADIAVRADVQIVANNGVRDAESVREYLEYGADAVSVGRPSDDPRVLSRVRKAAESYFETARPEVER
ncbi:MAG: tRNA-dihydrouridine synthase [Natrialbaceae archaeon]